MAEAVVDRLEVVDVEEENGQLPAIASAARQGVVDAIGEERAVGQAGQPVVERLELQLALETDPSGDIADDHDRGRAAREHHVGDVELDIDDAAALGAMPGVAEVLLALLRDGHTVSLQLLGLVLDAQIGLAESEELIARIPVHVERGVVDGEVAERLHIEEEHGLRVALEEGLERAIALGQRDGIRGRAEAGQDRSAPRCHE